MPGRVKSILRSLAIEPGWASARRLLVSLWLALHALTGFAQSDLNSVLAAAEEADPIYREAQAAALAIAEQVPQARAALWLPRLSFNAGISRVRQDISSAFAFGSSGEIAYTAKNYRISLEQPVYHHDRYVALRQADRRVEQAQLEVLAARQDLMVRVAERYFTRLAARDNVDFAHAETESLQGQLEQAKQRFEVGLIAITDVQEAQAGYDRALASEISANNELENSNEGLREITARYDLDLLSLGENMPLVVPEPLDIEAWTAAALEQNIELDAALAATDIAHAEIRRQYAGHYPTFDIFGSHGFNKQGGRFGGTSVDQGDIGIEVNVPLYEGGQVVSRTRAATHEHSAAIERVEQTRRAVQRAAREAYLGIVTQISAVKALRQAVVSSQTALDSTRAGFEVGTRTAIDVVAAERSLSQAKRDYARARYDYILQTLRLKHAAGSLEPADLAAVNGWLGHSPATP